MVTADELLQEYRRMAIGYGKGVEACEPEETNAYHDKLADVRRALRDLGQGHRILELLDDPSKYIRMWAGFDALYFSPEDGLRALRELEQGPRGDVRFNAAMILKGWNDGDLVLWPWEDEK